MASHIATRTASVQPSVIRTGILSIRRILAVLSERRALAKLDDDRLADLGLTHADVDAELRRAPWDAPRHWKR